MPRFTNPRERRHRIDFYSVDDSATDAFGESTQVANLVATVWGSLEPIKGREFWQGQQVHADTTHGITILYRPTIAGLITSKHVAKKGSRTFQLTQPPRNVNERNRELAIEVQERES